MTSHRTKHIDLVAYAILGAAIGLSGLLLLDKLRPARPASPAPAWQRVAAPRQRTRASIPAPFANCAEARAFGAAPVYAGQPGYGSHLDADHDGIGCEPYLR